VRARKGVDLKKLSLSKTVVPKTRSLSLSKTVVPKTISRKMMFDPRSYHMCDWVCSLVLSKTALPNFCYVVCVACMATRQFTSGQQFGVAVG
jgi:hypothetical protein